MRFVRPNSISTEVYAAVVSSVSNARNWELCDNNNWFVLDVSEFLEDYEF